MNRYMKRVLLYLKLPASLYSTMVIMLVMATHALGTTIDITHVSTGTINGDAVSFTLDNNMDTVSGVFAGTFMIQGNPSVLGGIGNGFFSELTIPPWDHKLLWQPPGFETSIYELSGFHFTVDMTTEFFGDPVGSNLGTLEVMGDARDASFTGSFVETVNVSNTAPVWTAVTNFSPMGPGVVGFDTVHLANGITPYSQTTGEITFLGDNTAVLRSGYTTNFSVAFEFTDDNPDDGILTGTLEGQVALVPEPSTYLLFVVGMLGIIGMGYRQRKKAA